MFDVLQEIPYKYLQRIDNGKVVQHKASSCQFRFHKKTNEINRIRGTLEVTQEGNDEIASGYFDIDMIPQWEPSRHFLAGKY